MSEFRWLLVAAGILILALVFWWSRREPSGRSTVSRFPLTRPLPGFGPDDHDQPSATTLGTASGAPTPSVQRPHQPTSAERIVTVRLTGRGNTTFPGEALVLALRDAGLQHGRFGIFHRHDPKDDSQVLFSVASLVEPGSFDLTRLKTDRFPGVSVFVTLPGTGDGVAAFDAMMATARGLAAKLNGELLDERGSRLSVQRERYLREEVIQFQHKFAPP